jgi:DNA replication factor Dna2
MKLKDFTVSTASALIKVIVKRNAEGLLACRVTSREAEQELLKFVPQLQRFANEYTEFGQMKGPRHISQCAVLEDPGSGEPKQFIAKSAEAIEEPIVSPELGLKGNVDMLAKAMTAKFDRALGQQQTVAITGVELKTGHNQRPQHAHIAQLALYIVMMQTRYGVTTDKSQTSCASESGVLIYINNEAVRAVHISPMMSEIKSLIGQRNVLAIEQQRASRPRGVHISYEDDDSTAKSKVRYVNLLRNASLNNVLQPFSQVFCSSELSCRKKLCQQNFQIYFRTRTHAKTATPGESVCCMRHPLVHCQKWKVPTERITICCVTIPDTSLQTNCGILRNGID